MHRQQWQQWHCNIKTETTCSSSYKRMSKGKHKCKGKRMSKGTGVGKCQGKCQRRSHPCYLKNSEKKTSNQRAPDLTFAAIFLLILNEKHSFF